jgi:hypothetical protein
MVEKARFTSLSTGETMTCPRCETTITEEFYCINCGYVPPRSQAEKKLEPEIPIVSFNGSNKLPMI